MEHPRVWTTAGVIALTILVLVGAYFLTGWNVARDVAVSLVAGEATQMGPTDSSWGQPLGHPDREVIVVRTHPGWLAVSPTLSFFFDLSDGRNPASPIVQLGVTVMFTTRGWEVVGYGDVG